MDPINVVEFGQFVESTGSGDVYRLQGVEWLVFQEYAEGFGYGMFCRQI